MNIAQKRPRMSVEEYLDWYEQQGEGKRFELIDGEPCAMAPERVTHAETKASAHMALAAAAKRDRGRCFVLPDGMTVRIDSHTAFEPDALVYCGERLPGDTIVVPEPVIVVEVLSPSTRHIDSGLKLRGYFALASVQHYIVLDPVARTAIHHRRLDAERIETRILKDGWLDLSPPGLTCDVTDFFPAA